MGKRTSAFCEWRRSSDPGLIIISERVMQLIKHMANRAEEIQLKHQVWNLKPYLFSLDKLLVLIINFYLLPHKVSHGIFVLLIPNRV
jgi:hypothetical protein